MIPTWVAVVTGISLAILALSAIAIAVSSVIAALGVRAFLRVFRELAGPALGDVRQLVTTIRTEADGLVGTSQDLRGRIVRAADAAEARLADLDALFEVVQEEVETTALDVARSEEHTSELQSQSNLVCRLLLEKKKKNKREAS